MKVKRVFIKNYMSIGENPIEITFNNDEKLILVGENNVGKSCILKAIHRCLNFQDTAFVEEEWHKADRNRTIEIVLDVSLDDEDLLKILEFLDLPSSALNEAKRDFGSILRYNFEKSLGASKAFFNWGPLRIFNVTGSIFEVDPTTDYRSVRWAEICSEHKKTSKPLKLIIEEKLSEKESVYGPPLNRIDFGRDLRTRIVELLKENIVLFPEFREISEKSLVDILVSPTGRELASVLFNLKNNRELKERQKFRKIQQHFTQFFSDLELDTVRERNEIKISVKRNGIESTTGFFGAGIFEMILFLTHIIAHKNKLLCIDEPELHLHPQAQKLLASFIEESNGNQFLTITHSPFFINPSKPDKITRVVLKNGQSYLISIPPNYWTPEELEKLSQLLDVDSLELFFARKVLLVDGQTEVGALPIFSKHAYDFLKEGVSTIGVSGKKNFPLFIKLLKGFEIPFVVVLDRDANDPKDNEFQMEIKRLVEKPEHVVILTGKFEEILQKHRPGLLKEAEEKVGKSKPRIGRYVALELIKRREVPSEFLAVINAVKECK